MRRAASAVLRSLPLPGRPVPLSAQSCAERAQRHATQFAEAPDERREGNACGWRSRVARAVAAARQEPCANVQHSPRCPRLRRRGPTATSGRKPPTLDAGTETLGEYVTGTWAASMPRRSPRRHSFTTRASTTTTSVRTSGQSPCVRSRRRSSGVGRPTAWHRGRVPLRFGMRWICLARSWSTHSWAGTLGESCPAREEGEVAPAGGGAAACARNDRGNACIARRPRRDPHLHPRICGSSSW